MKRRIGRKAIGEWADEQPGEQADETGTDVHDERFRDNRRTSCGTPAGGVPSPGGWPSLVLGTMTPVPGITVGSTCGVPVRDRTANE